MRDYATGVSSSIISVGTWSMREGVRGKERPYRCSCILFSRLMFPFVSHDYFLLHCVESVCDVVFTRIWDFIIYRTSSIRICWLYISNIFCRIRIGDIQKKIISELFVNIWNCVRSNVSVTPPLLHIFLPEYIIKPLEQKSLFRSEATYTDNFDCLLDSWH